MGKKRKAKAKAVASVAGAGLAIDVPDGEDIPLELKPSRDTSPVAFLVDSFRRLEVQGRWYVLIGLGFTLGILMPAGWAVKATGSPNEAVAVLQLRAPLDLIAASAPTAGLILMASLCGAALAVLLPAVVVPKGQVIGELSKRRYWFLMAVSLISALVLGPLASLIVLQFVAGGHEGWPWGLAAGGFAVSAFLIFGALPAQRPGGGKLGPDMTSAVSFVGFGLALGAVVCLGWALSPLPDVSLRDGSGAKREGLLLEIAPEGVWMIEYSAEHVGERNVVWIEAELDAIDVSDS